MKLESILAYCRHTDEKKQFQQYMAQRIVGVPRRVLDGGCGTGVHAVFLADLFADARIDAIDSSAELLRYAQKEHARANIRYQHA